MPYYPFSGGVNVSDEGGAASAVDTIDFAGAGVTAAVVGSTATITVTGGSGSFAVTQTEVDLGSTPANNGQFTISSGSISNGQKMIITQAADPYTGKGTTTYDEGEMDNITFMPRTCTAGACIVHWSCDTKVKGNVKVNWSVA